MPWLEPRRTRNHGPLIAVVVVGILAILGALCLIVGLALRL